MPRFFVFFIAVFTFLLPISDPIQAMTRTLKKEPAIIIVAFGTTTRAMATYDFFEEQLKESLPEKYKEYRVEWAFTSEIVRERANIKFKSQGLDRRFLSLPQVLADLEDAGYREIALQSLHVFAGQEFEDMEKEIAAFRTLGLRIEYGGVLLHEWEEVFKTIELLEPEFLKEDEGCNILVAHGTPETFAGSNSTYLGLERYLSGKYKNVFAGGVSGVLTRDQALARAVQYGGKTRLIPFMYVAGDHIMNDIMGEEPDKKGELSWFLELKQEGLDVETLYSEYKGERYFRGLGFYEGINRMFIKSLVTSLDRLEY